MAQRPPAFMGCVIAQQDAPECRHVLIRSDSGSPAIQQPDGGCATDRMIAAYERGKQQAAPRCIEMIIYHFVMYARFTPTT